MNEQEFRAIVERYCAKNKLTLLYSNYEKLEFGYANERGYMAHKDIFDIAKEMGARL